MEKCDHPKLLKTAGVSAPTEEFTLIIDKYEYW